MNSDMRSKDVADEEQEQTMIEYVIVKLKQKFEDNIPSESAKELPKEYMYPYGFICYAAMISTFITLFYQGYTANMKEKFISLDKNAGRCEPVLKPVNGVYRASNKGLWETSLDFIPNTGVYRFVWTGLTETDAGFAKGMRYFFTSQGYTQLAYFMSIQDLASNLVTWSSYRLEVVREESIGGIDFYLDGEASSIFDTASVRTAMANVNGTCNVSTIVSYNVATSKVTASYPHAKFVSDPVCKSVLDPAATGFQENLDGEYFTVSFDTRSFMTAMAVNKNMISLNQLETIEGDNLSDEVMYYRGVKYNFNYMWDKKYEGMDPIICLRKNTENRTSIYYNNSVESVCLLEMIDVVAFPTFNHNGAGFGLDLSDTYIPPLPCDCDGAGWGHNYYCNIFDFSAAFIVVPGLKAEQDFPRSFQAFLSLFDSISPRNMSREAYNATFFAASAHIPTEKLDPVIQTEEWRRKSFEFSYSAIYGYAGIMTFSFVDGRHQNVNSRFHALPYGSCKDSATISEEYWSKLAENPPVELTEPYFECTQKPWTAFSEATGVATGNASLLISAMAVALLPLVYIYLRSVGYTPPKEEYSEDEIKEASDTLAIQLLRARDGKVRGLKANGPLIAVCKDLIRSAKREGGYPDSDDDDDDGDSDEEEESGKSRRRKIANMKNIESRVTLRKRNAVFAKSVSLDKAKLRKGKDSASRDKKQTESSGDRELITIKVETLSGPESNSAAKEADERFQRHSPKKTSSVNNPVHVVDSDDDED